jgi:hypothetical protein
VKESSKKEGQSMTVHHGLSPRWLSGAPAQRNLPVQSAAIGLASVSALLYLLSGTVGSLRLGFTLGMTAAFALVAVGLLYFAGRRAWGFVALLDLVAIVGYFAVAPSRDPHFEVWGIAIKVVQVALLAAVGYLLIRDRKESVAPRPN